MAAGIGVSEALLIVKEGFEVIVPLLLSESIVNRHEKRLAFAFQAKLEQKDL